MPSLRMLNVGTLVAVAVGIILISLGSPAPGIASEFAYSGDIGPGFWGALRDDWRACGVPAQEHMITKTTADLARQSPINIHFVRYDPDLQPLDLHLEDTPINLMNNGHTIEQEYEPGSTVTFEGVIYELLQFHFHTLSEHGVKGKRGVMELHAVFRNASSGNLLVIGQLYRLGEESPFLAQFHHLLPKMKGDHESAREDINLADGLINTQAYYTYPGSLTTPPCSGIVTWVVLKKHATMSKRQFLAFNSIMGNNYRPFQALNDRDVRATFSGPATHRK